MFTGLAIIVLGVIALVVTSFGSGRDLKDLLIVWVGGLSVIALLAALGLAVAQWSPFLGWLIFFVLSLYAVDRMFRS